MDLIDRQAAIDAILAVTGNSSVRELYEHVQEHELSDMWSGGVNAAIDIIIAVPSAQPDSKETSYTHKALDTISRQAAIRWVKTECNPYGKPTLDFESGKKVIEHLKQMPSAQPEIIRCKDCKHWRDSDGVYRRGINAESKCPLNTQEVYAGTFYCGYAERRPDDSISD